MRYKILSILFLLVATNAQAFEVYGTIRNTGKGFEVINDAEHKPLNICNVITTKTTVSFDFCGNKAKFVHTLIITPDETYAIKGVLAGASVGLDKAVIQFGNGKLINPQTLTESSGNFWIYGKLG